MVKPTILFLSTVAQTQRHIPGETSTQSTKVGTVLLNINALN
ncbi:hypothetical protein TRICHSKD4_5386 [Roseibium sp. TrichSKD4]|nr:hypothetical protein TRICHSKD4_5386 [Roseibium sp. TrichSKD4]